MTISKKTSAAPALLAEGFLSFGLSFNYFLVM